MVREDIVGGMRIALSKGEKLQDIMQSFYNAGYTKEDIEEAARALYRGEIQSTAFSEPVREVEQKPTQQIQRPVSKLETQKPQIPFPSKLQIPFSKTNSLSEPRTYVPSAPKQTISSYDTLPKKNIDFITILLIIILVLLLGVLAGVFFFKEELVEFFSNFLD